MLVDLCTCDKAFSEQQHSYDQFYLAIMCLLIISFPVRDHTQIISHILASLKKGGEEEGG